MKKTVLISLLIALVLCNFRVFSSPSLNEISPSQSEATSAINDQAIEQSLKSHVEFLADDKLKGRNTGSAEYEIAAQYVASHFQQFGLTPGGDISGDDENRDNVSNEGKSWFQTVPLIKSHINESSVKMVASNPDSLIEFSYPQHFALLPSATSPVDKVKASLVFVGYGIDSLELNRNDYAGLDIQGKIVVMLAGRPRALNNEIGAHVTNLRLRLRHAEQRGAVGVIILQTARENKVRPFSSIVSFANKPFLNWKTKQEEVFDSYNNLKSIAYLNVDAGKQLFSAAGLDIEKTVSDIDADNYLRGFDINIDVAFERKSIQSEITSSNIIGILEGSDPHLKNEYVVYSTHLDHLGVNETNKNIINNGALDNATGVAILLETARQFVSGNRPKRSMVFLVVTGEEKGLLGSNYFVHNSTVPRSSIVANINIDMPIILYPFADMIAFGAQHSTLEHSAKQAVTAQQLKLTPDPIPEQALFVRSDHYSFVKQGIPSTYLMPGFTSSDPKINSFKLFKEYITKHYHQPSDDITLPIDFGAGVTFTKVNKDIGENIANRLERPRWNNESFFGKSFNKQPFNKVSKSE